MACWHGWHGCGPWYGPHGGGRYGPPEWDPGLGAWPARPHRERRGRRGREPGELEARIAELREEIRLIEEELGELRSSRQASAAHGGATP